MSQTIEDNRKSYNDYYNYCTVEDNNEQDKNKYDYDFYEESDIEYDNLYDLSVDINYDIHEYIKNTGLEIGQYLSTNDIYEMLEYYL